MTEAISARIPGAPHGPGPGDPPDRPGDPFWPSQPPSIPPGQPGQPGGPAQDPVSPTRVWIDPHAGWQAKLRERLLARRIVLAAGILDDDAAARLSAELMALDAEDATPIRLEFQNLRAELSAVLTVMGILDVLKAPVHGCVSGELSGPGLGLLAACARRTGYPNAIFTLAEPRVRLTGTATAISAREEQVQRMLDTVYFKLAGVTGRPAEDIRDDARHGRVLTVAQALGYGLIQAQETTRPDAV
jgi:ATP-dependent protease ClpP protease subunit